MKPKHLKFYLYCKTCEYNLEYDPEMDSVPIDYDPNPDGRPIFFLDLSWHHCQCANIELIDWTLELVK